MNLQKKVIYLVVDTSESPIQGGEYYYGFNTTVNYTEKLNENIGEFGGKLTLITNDKSDMKYLNRIFSSLLIDNK